MIILRAFSKLFRLILAAILTMFVWAFDILGKVLSFAGAFAVWIFIICIITVCICGLWSSLPLLLGIIGVCVAVFFGLAMLSGGIASLRDRLLSL